MKHILTPQEREKGLRKALSPEGQAARIASLRTSTTELHQYVRESYEYGWTIKKIADETGLADATVSKLISGCSRPRYGRGFIVSSEEGAT